MESFLFSASIEPWNLHERMRSESPIVASQLNLRENEESFDVRDFVMILGHESSGKLKDKKIDPVKRTATW